MLGAAVVHWFWAHLVVVAAWTTFLLASVLLVHRKWHLVEDRVRVEMIKEMERMCKVKVDVEKVIFKPLEGHMSLRGLTIFGSPGQWSHDHFAHIESMTCTTFGWLGVVSLAGMQSLSPGTHLPFVFGFKGKMVDEMTCEGVAVHHETNKLTGRSNADFLHEMDRADREKSRFKQRRLHEAELRWRIRWTSDAGKRADMEERLAALREEDEEERRKEEDRLEAVLEDHADVEHAAFMSAFHLHVSDAASTHAHHFEKHHEAVRARIHRHFAERKEHHDMRRDFARLRGTDMNREIMHVGRCTVNRCTFELVGSKLHLDRPATIEAFSGTFLEFQRKVSRHVLTVTLSDSFHHEQKILKEKLSHEQQHLKEMLSHDGQALKDTFSKGSKSLVKRATNKMGKLAKRMSLSGSPTSSGKRKSRANSDDTLRSRAVYRTESLPDMRRKSRTDSGDSLESTASEKN